MSQEINLYDPSLRKQYDWLSAANLAAGALALLLLIGGAGAWERSRAGGLEAEAAAGAPQLQALQGQLQAASKALAERKPSAALGQELATAQALLATRGEILAVLQKGLGPQATGFSEYLRGLARQTPNGLWLTGFSVAADGTAMEIRGRTLDPALLPEYIRRLNTERAFQGRAFAALQLKASAPAPAPAPAAATTAQPAATTPSYHEFTLVPQGKEPGAAAVEKRP